MKLYFNSLHLKQLNEGEYPMEDKQALLRHVTPVAVLKAITPESKSAITNNFLGNEVIGIWNFPFRMGRESRVEQVGRKAAHSERNKISLGKPNNDIYLMDLGQYLQISRQHIQIDKTENGFLLIDRESACGTIVNTIKIGSEDRGGNCELKDGDIIKIGSKKSPYEFQFITL
jgi:pSer/pThr/pTyr-binding forkhead associated (FHA) protein